MGCVSSSKVKMTPPSELDNKALNIYNLRMRSHTHYAGNVPKNIYVAWCIAKYNEDCISIENYNNNLKLPEEVLIKFPDIKLPGISQVSEPVTKAVIGAQDRTIKNLNKIDKVLKS